MTIQEAINERNALEEKEDSLLRLVEVVKGKTQGELMD